MRTSAAWINDYLDPPATAQEQADFLTRAGFPMEHHEFVMLPDGSRDERQEIELTSNRGDCLCHLGLAREIVAISGGNRKLKTSQPSPVATGPKTASVTKVTNREPERCPLYSARIIRGVKVGPSPPWLAKRLLGRGDIPRNNIVDASNFVLFELGQPTHVFDFAKLRGSPPQIIVRKANHGEPFLPIGEGAAEVKLTEQDLVIADAERAVAIAGVKGGALTAVTASTTDILIESATFDPVSVRNTSRRLGIASDSSYRFERGVDLGQVLNASDRLVDLILQLCGGELLEGAVNDGMPVAPPRKVSMRCDRCRKILGIPVTNERMAEALDKLGFEPHLAGAMLNCTVPYERLDVKDEIDLIEEVGRVIGLEAVPIADTIQIRIAPPQPAELAQRAVREALVGMGYVETVTHSLISEPAALAFLPPDLELLRVADERAKAEPALRPSILPSLLRVFALNQNHGATDIKLFESGATFAMLNRHPIERVNLAVLQTASSPEDGVREIRGTIDRLTQIIFGPAAPFSIEPTDRIPWFSSAAVGRIKSQVLGTFGVISPAASALFGIKSSVYAAEIGLPHFYDLYPPIAEAAALPQYPSIERDLSAVVNDRLPWGEMKSTLESLQLQHLETIDFVTTFRGKQVGAGKKSLTLRLTFRSADRTLTHGEVDPQMADVIATLQSKFGAELRK